MTSTGPRTTADYKFASDNVTRLVRYAVGLRAWQAVPGTDTAYAARFCGTDIGGTVTRVRDQALPPLSSRALSGARGLRCDPTGASLSA
eukprot:2331872-Rhodomonas_salina.8